MAVGAPLVSLTILHFMCEFYSHIIYVTIDCPNAYVFKHCDIPTGHYRIVRISQMSCREESLQPKNCLEMIEHLYQI